MAKKKNNKANILFRYGVITIGFALMSLMIMFKVFQTTVIEAKNWNDYAKKELSKMTVITPERGSILADDGSILACNLTLYDIKIDLRHDKIRKMKVIPWASVDSLADSLDRYYPRRPNLDKMPPDSFQKYSWHTRLKKEFEKDPNRRNRALRLAKKQGLEDFNRIRNFPFLRTLGKKCKPLYKEVRQTRLYPYGDMACLSIGRVNEDQKTKEIHGYSGLEKDLDSLLYGKPGLAKKTALTRGIGNWISVPAVRGYDIHSTINIDLQEMLEDELKDICVESKAEWGTAVLMEVKTGEIKAISNIELLEDGTYGEAMNRAVLPYEPGSVMKPISLMIAFEDGLVKSVNDMVDCSPFMRTSDPHGSGPKTMKQVIEQSSNTGISRVIFRGYAQHPEKWYDRLKGLGFFEPMHSGIAFEKTPRIRRLVDKDSKGNNITMTARHLDLARQAYGYNTELPPLFTLSVYNAIANDGKYVRPHLVRSLIDENGRDSVLKISYIRDSICSAATARKVRECIHEVVWGDHGTARMVRDDRVKIVGKTGTAYPVEHGVYNTAKRRYAFAGFFPYENPQYSCIVLILANAGTSANRTSGQVLKNMAIKMYSRGMLNNSSTFTAEKTPSSPVISASTRGLGAAGKAINITSMKRLKPASDTPQGTVPNVVGYDIADAIAHLEKIGLNVKTRGQGMVTSQSIPPGTPIKRGGSILLYLSTK